MQQTVQPIILAAGKGSRMGNPELPKVLIDLNGKPLIEYLLDTLTDQEFKPAALVVGYKQEQVKEALGNKYRYITQEEQLGTGHALKVCEESLKGTALYYLLAYGDTPLLSIQTLRRLVTIHEATESVLSMVTFKSDREMFYNFGRIIRDAQGKVVAIREYKDCTPEEKEIKEYNPGFYCFSDGWLWEALKKIKPVNAQGEYYLTDLVAIAVGEGRTIPTIEAESWVEAAGVNTPEQLEEVSSILRSRSIAATV